LIRRELKIIERSARDIFNSRNKFTFKANYWSQRSKNGEGIAQDWRLKNHMRVLVTGATGFAGSHLVDHIATQGTQIYVLVRKTPHVPSGVIAIKGDLTDPASLKTAIAQAKPDLIYHLAGQADVGRSWKTPAKTLQINAIGTINLIEAVIENKLNPRIIVVTSGDIYGQQPPEAMPITEDCQPKAYHPYGVSKIAASQLVHIYYQRYKLDIIEARPFNHIGPRQALGFVVPDFASQIAAIKLGQQPPCIQVGSLQAQRDFTDVRDMVAAYASLADHGRAGETYLICSGNPIPIRTILDTLADIAGIDLRIEQDPQRMRPSDTPLLYGSPAKIKQDTGWTPKISLYDSLTAVLQEWEKILRHG